MKGLARMKALNWPNLMATTESQLYLVNKTYLEYSSLDTFILKCIRMQRMRWDGEWRGQTAFKKIGASIFKRSKLCSLDTSQF